MGDGQGAVVVEVDLLGDDDPIRFSVYTNELMTKDEILQNLGQAMMDFDTYEDGEGYYPGVYSDQSNNHQSVTAEYKAVSKESSDYLADIGKKILNIK